MDYPKTARAALLTEFREPVEVRDVETPAELEPGALLVRVTTASVCGTDVHTWLGGAFTANRDNLPSVMGHEMVGEVVAFGDGPQTDSVGQPLAVGDRVLWTHAPCGTCYYCSVGRSPSLCTARRSYGRLRVTAFPHLTGGFAEYCYVFPTSGRVRVPANVPDSLAAPASCALRTVVHLLERVGAVDPDQSVVVQGTGPLGLYAVALLKQRGVDNIVAVGAPDERLELATAYGAAEVVSVERYPDPVERERAVLQTTAGGRGADVVLEMSGAPAAFTEGIRLVAPGGRYGIAGQTSVTEVPVDPSLVVRRQLSVIGALSAHVGHYWKALELLSATRDKVDWEAMVGTPRPLAQVTEAMNDMRRGVMKPLIDPQA
jgi:L-iditol 2-dehydrogenase